MQNLENPSVTIDEKTKTPAQSKGGGTVDEDDGSKSGRGLNDDDEGEADRGL